MSRITPKDLAASLLKKFSPSKAASEETSLTPGDVDNLAAMMKSPNRLPPRNEDDIEDVEGAEYESYKAKETLSSEGLGGAQLSIGNALRQIENKSPMNNRSPFKGEAKSAKGKANNAKDKKKASAGEMQIEEKENDTAIEEEEAKGKDAKKKEVKKKGKSSDETKKDGMEEEGEKPKDDEEKPAKTVKNFKKKKVQVEEDKEEKSPEKPQKEKSQEKPQKEKSQEKEKEKEKEKPKEKKGLNGKRKGKETDDEGEGEGEEKDEEVDTKKKQTKKLKKEDGEKVVAKKDEKNKSAEKKGKKEEASAEKDKAEKEKAKKERKNKKKEDDDEEKEKTEEKPEEDKEDEGESAKKKKVGGIKSNEGSGTKKIVSFKDKDSGKKENKDNKDKEEPKKLGKFIKLTIDEEKLKDAVLKNNKKGTATTAVTKGKKDTKDVKEKKGKDDKKDKKKTEGKKEKKAKGEKKEKEEKDGKKKKSGKKGKKKDEEEDEMEIEDDDEENDKESNMSQLYDDSEEDEDEEGEEENEFDDDDGEFRKKVLKESGPEIDTYWKKNLRENATPEKKKVSGTKGSPFDTTSSLKKTSKKVMNFSGLTQDDTEFLYASIKKLGGFDIQNLQDPSLTHLIYTGEKRTIKALYALAKRAWILEIGYVYSSFEFGDWIAEKDFESASFPSKKARDEVGPLFKNMKFFFGSSNYLTLTLDELQNLVKLSGGKIVETKEEADVIIENGKEKNDPMEEISSSQGPATVNHKWVLDSLTKYEKLDFAEFPANE